MSDTEPTEGRDDADSPPQPEIVEETLQPAPPPAGQRPISDTIGTGSGCAIGCSVLAVAIIAVGILILLLTR